MITSYPVSGAQNGQGGKEHIATTILRFGYISSLALTVVLIRVMARQEEKNSSLCRFRVLEDTQTSHMFASALIFLVQNCKPGTSTYAVQFLFWKDTNSAHRSLTSRVLIQAEAKQERKNTSQCRLVVLVEVQAPYMTDSAYPFSDTKRQARNEHIATRVSVFGKSQTPHIEVHQPHFGTSGGEAGKNTYDRNVWF